MFDNVYIGFVSKSLYTTKGNYSIGTPNYVVSYLYDNNFTAANSVESVVVLGAKTNV